MIYNKPFGTFELSMEKGEHGVILRGRINNEESFGCKSFDETKKTLLFWTTHKVKIDGKDTKCNGINIPDFDEVYAEYNRMKSEITAEKAEKKKAEIEDIKSGKKKIKCIYQNGEYLSGYAAYGVEAELLLELKVAESVNGWGYLVSSKYIDVLGTEFTYQQAVDLTRPEREDIEQKTNEKEEQIKEIFRIAQETGEKQLISQWSEKCNDPKEECNTDIVYKYAMPDGTTKIERQHTW